MEFKIQRSVFISSHSAADSEEACELALEEVRNSDEAMAVDDIDIVDCIEED